MWIGKYTSIAIIYHFWGAKGVPILFSEIGFCMASCSYIYIYIYISINQSMALGASCAGHTRTQSHAALYKINNEVVHSEMVASYYKRGSE